VALQAILWLLAIVAVTDIGRFRRRKLIGIVTSVGDDVDQPTLRLDGAK
jgi:hypothetical protein